MSATRRYVRSCFLWTGASLSTDFSSTMTLFDNQVGTESDIEPNILPNDGNRNLSLDIQAAFLKFVLQDGEVDGFQKPGAKFAMDRQCRINDYAGKFVMGHGLVLVPIMTRYMDK